VGDDPTSDAISYFLYQYGKTGADTDLAPEEWAEVMLSDILVNEVGELRNHLPIGFWYPDSSHVEVV
jgi:hypothetical protein